MAGRTLWERLRGQNLPVPNEEKYNNPFKARIGNTFHLDTLEHSGDFYILKSIEVYDRGTGVPMVDYRLEARPFGSDEVKTLILRTVPRDGVSGKDKLDFRILALTPYYSCGWQDDVRKEIMQGVNDPAGEFAINPGTGTLGTMIYSGTFNGSSNGRSIWVPSGRDSFSFVQALAVTETAPSVPEGHPLTTRMGTSIVS